ncbi:hypothetical protein Gpo141_00002804 [Globisporangium polare]
MLPAQRLRMKPRTRLPHPGLREGPQSRRAQNPVPGAAIARVKTPERQGLARRGGNAAAASAPVARARLADPTMTTPSLNPNVASAPDVPAPNQVTLAANGEDPSGSIEGNFAAGLDFDTDDWGSDSESTERFTGDPGTDSHANNYHTPNVNSYHIPRAMFQGESDNYYNTNPSNLSTDAINNTTNLGYGGYANGDNNSAGFHNDRTPMVSVHSFANGPAFTIPDDWRAVRGSFERMSPFKALIRHLKSARSSLAVCMHLLTCQKITRMIIKMSQRPVVVLTDDNKTNLNHSTIRLLEHARVDVYRSKRTLHHKFSIVDAELVLAGSYNCSERARLQNYEEVFAMRVGAADSLAMANALLLAVCRLGELWQQ